MNRRQFLRGASGATVAIPFLGSLQPASAAPLAAPRRFVAFATEHGGIYDADMWPSDSLLTETVDIGHQIRRGELVADTDGSDRVLSAVLRADSSVLTPSLVEQLTLLRGLDVPFYMSHHTGGYLGNFGRNDGEFEGLNNLPYIPTIDQVMAWSDGFLGDTAGLAKRSIQVGYRSISFGWANPSSPGGAVDPLPLEWSSQALFEELFGSTQIDPEEPRRLVVDHVLESYRRLRDGAFGPARRLSAGDRDRLDAHIERLYEVERSLGAVVECGEIERPDGDTDGHPAQWGYSQVLDEHLDYYQLWNEVIALGLICGASRVATVFVNHPLYIYGGDWHQEVAHEAWVSEAAESRMVAGNQTFFEHVFCDLCERLDVPDCDGQSVLHHSLVMWNHESGQLTHDNFSTPTIVAGSAGGALSAGQYCDYRDRTDTSLIGTDSALHQTIRPGLLYSQWLATALRLCDVDEADWVTPGNPGYGVWYTERPQGVAGYVQAMANDVLPFLEP